MKKICLSIDQMLQLKGLGVETKDASMCWVRDPEGKYTPSIHDEYCYEMSFMNPVPAFTLQDMIEMMPKEIKAGHIYILVLVKESDGFCLEYLCEAEGVSLHTSRGDAISAAYNMLHCLLRTNTY